MARLVLVGVGHANLEVLRRTIVEPRDGLDLTVVSLSARQHYSGMVPGYLRGTYSEAEIAFDLPALTAAAGGAFVEAAAVGVDPGRRIVRLADGRTVAYDLVSFNVGSRTAGQETPSVRDHAVLVKPMSQAVELHRRFRELVGGPAGRPMHVAVVGAGAAGVEIACAAAELLDESRRERRVVLLEASGRILSGYSRRFRARAEGVLAAKRIDVRTASRVVAVAPDSVELEASAERGNAECGSGSRGDEGRGNAGRGSEGRGDEADDGGGGRRLPADLTVWLTGAAATPIFADSGLPCDERGFLLVDGSLRSLRDPRVFAAGDCATLRDHPATPKAGVYAVRQGPVLWESILAAVDERPPPTYTPQGGFLSILNTGDGKSLLRYKAIVSHSRWAWWLKDWIDRRFMRRYHSLA